MRVRGVVEPRAHTADQDRLAVPGLMGGWMSEDTENGEEVEEGGEEAVAEGGRKLSGKVLVLYIGLPALLVLGVGGYFAMTMLGSSEEAKVAETQLEKQVVFYDLPEILVNLSQREERAQFLKIKVSLEVPDKSVSMALQPVLPRILDTFQVYLRELRADDIEGSAGVYRLKEELLRRVNLAIRPRKIDRVLFKEIIVQ